MGPSVNTSCIRGILLLPKSRMLYKDLHFGAAFYKRSKCFHHINSNKHKEVIVMKTKLNRKVIRLSESSSSSEAEMSAKSVLILMEGLLSVDLFYIIHGIRNSKTWSEVQLLHILALGGCMTGLLYAICCVSRRHMETRSESKQGAICLANASSGRTHFWNLYLKPGPPDYRHCGFWAKPCTLFLWLHHACPPQLFENPCSVCLKSNFNHKCFYISQFCQVTV